MTVLIWIMVSISYVFIAMIAGHIIWKLEWEDDFMDSPLPLFGGIFWPLTIVVVTLYFVVFPLPNKAAKTVAGWLVK